MKIDHYVYKGPDSVPVPTVEEKQPHNKVYFFSSQICPFAQRTNIAIRLFLQNVIEHLVHYEFVLSDKRPDWFRALNPNDKVPVLIHNNNVIFESSVIVEYLNDEFHGAIPILPGNSYRRALFRALRHHFNEHFVGPMYRLWLAYDDVEKQKRERVRFVQSMEYVDSFLAKYTTGADTAEDGVSAESARKKQRVDNATAADNACFVDGHFGAFELCVAPFYQRWRALEFYRDAQPPARLTHLIAHRDACLRHPIMIETSIEPSATTHDEIVRKLVIFYSDYARGYANGRAKPPGQTYSSFDTYQWPLDERSMPTELEYKGKRSE